MKRLVFTIAVLSGPLVLAGESSAQERVGRYYGHGEMMGWGGWFFGPIMMVIVNGLLVGAVVLIMKLVGGSPQTNNLPQGDKAHSILRERFARGEITREEFEAAKKVLE